MTRQSGVMRRWWWILAAVIGLALVAVVLVWSDAFGGRTQVRAPLEEQDDERDRADDEEAWMLDEPRREPREREAGEREAGERRGERRGRGAGREGRRRWDPDSPEFAEQRARWHERWRQSVDIVALGPEAPGFDADAVREALSPGREALRECIGEQGGWRAMREASRSEAGDAGRPGPRMASFDVGSDGTVNPASLTMQPPMPAPFAQCFETFFTSATFPNAGDGARVELPMGPPGGRGGRGGRRESGRESEQPGRSFDRP